MVCLLLDFLIIGLTYWLEQYQNLGIEWASTLLGCLAALMLPIPLLLYIYGVKIRQRVKIDY